MGQKLLHRKGIDVDTIRKVSIACHTTKGQNTSKIKDDVGESKGNYLMQYSKDCCEKCDKKYCNKEKSMRWDTWCIGYSEKKVSCPFDFYSALYSVTLWTENSRIKR